METAGLLLLTKRKSKKISLAKAARDLHIKLEHLEAIENSKWQDLPEPTFVKGFIKSYAEYLNLDSDYLLAIFRREYDEAKYPHKPSPIAASRRLMLTPNKFITTAFILAIFVFVIYLAIQYFSILSGPKLHVTSPADDLTTNVPYVIVAGNVEKEATVAVQGEFVPIDSEGKFSYQASLAEGRNVIEIIASKRLSPKTKVTRVVSLAH